MKLIKSNVVFDQENHTYTLDGVRLSGITSMLESQLFPHKLDGIPQSVLDKAAERGTFIHECCEMADSLGVVPDCEEARNYIELVMSNSLMHEDSEYLVSDNRYYASSIDKVFRENDNTFHLADIKTTYRLDKEYVRWQLSIYAYLFETQNPGAKVGRLYAIWLRCDKAELVEVERIDAETIMELLASGVSGKQFDSPIKPAAKENNIPDKYKELELSIIEIDQQCKYWTDKRRELTDGVLKEMVKADVCKWQGESISFTRKKGSVRKDFDKKAFEADHPDLYKKYLKETKVAESITLKVS